MEKKNPLVSYEKAFEDSIREAFRMIGIKQEPVIKSPRSETSDLCLVAFPLAKELGMSPGRIAERIMDEMKDDPRWTLEVSGGYLNCTFKPSELAGSIGGYLWSKSGTPGRLSDVDEKIIVEHTSANPNGPFHVGRARNPMIGDAIVRLLRMAGRRVESQYWVNDMGKQVMVLVWGKANIDPSRLKEPERDKPDHDLVRYYQAANAEMESDGSVKQEIGSMLKRYEAAVIQGRLDDPISSEGKPVVRARDVREVCEIVLAGMKESLERLNVHIDRFINESRVVEDGSLEDVIGRLKQSSLCKEDDGALYLDLSDLIKGGDQDRFKRRFVFTRKDGSALYTTRDLAYHRWKLSSCDRAINILGEDHRYQSMMLDLALGELGLEKRPDVVFYSFVSLPDGKMSTRRGRVVYLDDLLDEAVERAGEEVRKRRTDLAEEDLDSISKAVGIGALRFNVISVQPEKKMLFKWEDALNFDGSTAPFVQYSHARACSILRKGEISEGDLEKRPIDWDRTVEESERNLLRELAEMERVVERSALDMKPHLLAGYLVGLASSFNDFYRDCPVLGEIDTERRSMRLAIVDLTRRSLAAGLETLGVEAPERM